MTSFLETWVFWTKHWLCSLSRTTLQRLVAIQTEWLSLERVREGQVLDFMSFLQYLLVRISFACTLHCYVDMLWLKYKCLLCTGLFQQAILQSGTELDSWSLQTPAENPSNYLRQVIQFVQLTAWNPNPNLTSHLERLTGGRASGLSILRFSSDGGLFKNSRCSKTDNCVTTS